MNDIKQAFNNFFGNGSDYATTMIVSVTIALIAYGCYVAICKRKLKRRN